MQINLGWTPQDSTLFTQWISAYATFLETDPLAKYARVMANYVGTSFDEQLLACYMYLGKCDSFQLFLSLFERLV
jgi:hypothetical protein